MRKRKSIFKKLKDFSSIVISGESTTWDHQIDLNNSVSTILKNHQDALSDIHETIKAIHRRLEKLEERNE